METRRIWGMSPEQREKLRAHICDWVDYEGHDREVEFDLTKAGRPFSVKMPNPAAMQATQRVALSVATLSGPNSNRPSDPTACILTGPVGVGKTTAMRNGVAISLAYGWGAIRTDGGPWVQTYQGVPAVVLGERSWFWPPITVLDTTAWFRRLRSCYDEDSEANEKDLVEGPGVTRGILVLEDIGKEGRGGDDLRHRSYEGLVDLRQRKGMTTLITTNLDPGEELKDWVGARAWSRLMKLSQDRVVRVDGEDMRLRLPDDKP